MCDEVADAVLDFVRLTINKAREYTLYIAGNYLTRLMALVFLNLHGKKTGAAREI